jgi:hypothetical protein
VAKIVDARVGTCVLIVAAFSACAQPALPPDPPSLAKHSAEESLNPSPVREIQVDHKGCFGPCPIYRFRLSDDGKWEWEGTKFVPHPGQRAGSIYSEQWSPLFIWLQSHPALYAASADRTSCCDQERVEFRFVLKSGKSVLVKYSLGFAGDDFWALSRIMDAIMERAMLREIKGSTLTDGKLS